MDRFFEAGLINLWYEDFIDRATMNHGELFAKGVKEILEFNDIGPYFYILLFGFFASFLIFLCENYFGRKERRVRARVVRKPRPATT